jgi:membrane protease subunit (stomatin/prohibitin family)
MAIIDLVQWSPEASVNIYAWRYPHSNLSTYTQLLVHESQEAVLFSKGQVVGKFGPGKHTLSTENLPILRSLFGLPFGGKNPFTAEVWFVNKLQPFNNQWSINNLSIHDFDYNVMVPIAADGQYGLRIVDTEKFLIKIVGTKSGFTERDLTDQFMGEISTKTKSSILQYMQANHIGFKQISAYLDTISQNLELVMRPFWSELGLELTKFYVNSITIDDSTSEGAAIKRAITQQAEQAITGRTWQQEQMFGTVNNAVDGFTNMASSGGTGGLLGGLMAINMMNGMNLGGGGGGAAMPVAQGMMNPSYNQPTFNGQQGAPQQGAMPMNSAPQQGVKMVYCSNCAKKYPSTSQFCPQCGDPYNPCPNCGTDNDINARRCISCGVHLNGGAAGATCPQCHAPLTPGSSFCSSCGTRVATSDNVCSRCGATFAPGAKFCQGCGNRR